MNKVNKEQAIEYFKKGSIGIFPTDTAFGIGCIVTNPQSIQRLFSIKKRPQAKAVPVLVSSIQMAENITNSKISEDVKKLMKKYWPGGLTIVLPCLNNDLLPLVTGGTKTLGVRVPDHEAILDVITKVGLPILAPSANFSGERTPFCEQDIDSELMGLVDFYFEGECKGTKASTVLDCTKKPYRILRKGAVDLKEEIL